MKVERVSIEAVDALVAARMAYLAEDFGGLDAGDAAAISAGLPSYFRSHLDRDLFCYAIWAEGAMAACAFLLVIEKPMSPAFLNGRTGAVLNVYTRPEYRRRGYARAVMGALLRDAEAMGLCRIELKSTDDGYALYRSLGFEDDVTGYRHMRWKR